MAKRVLFRLMGGDCETGFSVAVEVFRESDSRLIADVEGKLPPVQNILENYQNWQENYRSLVNGRDSSPRLSVEAATYSEILTKIANAKIQLDSSVNSWFHPQEPFLPVWTTLLQSLTKHEEIRVVLKTSNTQLQQLPLFLWKAFFDHYYRAELSLCLPVSDSDISPIPRDKVKVLAIFGKKQITETTTPINTEEDWNQLKKLLSQESNAELIKLKEPSLEELSQEIIKQEPQILFFAGHSSSHNEQGLIYLNQKEKITISFLRNVLIKAVKNSLQLAIFNSCDGIAIAQQLSETRIPNIIVMRESIPDLVAQKFLQRFLEAFAAGKSLNLAVRRAREKIGFLELQYPGATLLPMLWENPSTPPLTWKSLGGIETKRKQARNIPYNPDAEIKNKGSILWLQDPNEANIKPKNYENIDNSQTKKCPNCSKEVPNNANFCIFCGYKLGEYSTCIQDSLEIDISGNSSLTTTLEESPQSEIILAEHYQIIRTLGSGSFGNTFLARDIRLPSNRFCVVKVLKSCISNSQIHDFIQARFEREAVILEKLGDEIVQIPKLYAYFAEKGEFYLVQEYIQGDTLSQKVTETGTFDSEKVKAILVELLSVLVEVHRYQIIHRDIKPDNIILRSSNNQPVLIDFGAMKEVVGSMPENNSDSPGTVIIGTPGFMPGEQASGRPVYASDLYALALTAIYLLTGKLPHEIEQNEYTGELLWHQFAENFAPELVEVLDKAIQPHLEFRYQTAAEMLEALQTRKKLVTYPSEFPAIAPTSTVKNYSDQKKSGLIKRIFLYLAYFVFGIVLFAMLSGILLLVLSN